MNIIDEMRNSLPPYVPIKQVRAWADRLAAANILVAVPVGEECELFDLPIEAAAFTCDKSLFIYEGMTTDWLAFNVSALRWAQLEVDTIVQSVCIKTLSEAEI